MATDTLRRTHCDFSCTDPMCRTLDRAGVPPDAKWRTLILYMRSMEEYDTITHPQKAAIQHLVLEALRNKNFSEAEFRRLIARKQEILGEPCNAQLQTALAETVTLVEEIGALLTSRKDDVTQLGHSTVEALQSGQDPLQLVARIRQSFQSVVQSMEEDANHFRILSHTDALTGLGNRRAFDAALAQMLARWEQAQEPGCLALFDIDHFKKFNDLHGHRIGDQALTVVGRILRTYVEKAGPMLEGSCQAFRFGGEEFAMLFPNASLETVLAHADTVRSAVRKHRFLIRDPQGAVVERNMYITVSAGVAALSPDWERDPSPGVSPEISPRSKDALAAQLLDAADKALYRAKRNGRDMVLPQALSRA